MPFNNPSQIFLDLVMQHIRTFPTFTVTLFNILEYTVMLILYAINQFMLQSENNMCSVQQWIVLFRTDDLFLLTTVL